MNADQHSTDPENGVFFMRVEFLVEDGVDRDKFALEFFEATKRFNPQWSLYDKSQIMRMGILVSKPGHCLVDLLYLWRSGELRVEIPFVASNYEAHRQLVEQFKVPFYFIPADKSDRKEAELLQLASRSTDFLVLARYMQVLSNDFLNSYGKDIINIHHGFLPSFKGPSPYRQALDKGVKIIGATAHFVTGNLDEGPIISQAVVQITHRDSLDGLVRKGKNLEKHALSDAVFSYVDRRIIRFADKTIVF